MLLAFLLLFFIIMINPVIGIALAIIVLAIKGKGK